MVTKRTTGLGSKTSNPQTKTPSDYPFEKHRKYIYNSIYSYIQDHHLTEDITQKTLLKAWRNRHSYDPKRGKAVSWLYIIARNVLIDHMRLQRPVTVPHIEGYVDVDVDGYAMHDGYAVHNITPDLESIKNETATRVNAQVDLILNILDEHPFKYGTLLRLQFFQGLMGKEFAQVVGLHRGTVRWRIYRAKLLFREEWQKRFATPKGGTT